MLSIALPSATTISLLILWPLHLPCSSTRFYYTYKLWECLLSQVGYYHSLLELAANMDNNFENHMYLIQMHLRHPDHLHIFKALKAISYYITNASLLP
jgi:hypothetical protein